MTTLSDVADIRLGYSYRGSLKNTPDGNTAVIQMRDMSQDDDLQADTFTHVQIDQIAGHYFLQPGDLIFRPRGLVNTALLIDTPMPRTICIAPLMFIRIRDKARLLPAYLQWFINLSVTQRKLDADATGTTVRVIPAAALADLVLLLPSVARQQKIITTTELNRAIRRMEARLAEQRQCYTKTSLIAYAKGLSH